MTLISVVSYDIAWLKMVKEILDTAETNPSMEIAATTDLYVWIVWPMRHRQPRRCSPCFLLVILVIFLFLFRC